MLCTRSITLVSLCVLSERQSNQTNPGRPTMCRSCGAIVGAGETQCAVCGASTSQPAHTTADHRQPDRETMRFARAVLNRPYKFTIIFLVANLFVFLLMWESSGMTSHGAVARLSRTGADSLWRETQLPDQCAELSMVAICHADVSARQPAPLAGKHVQPVDGWTIRRETLWLSKVCCVLGGDGSCGVVASYLTVRPQLATGAVRTVSFQDDDDPSAGASGALFGLVGVLFVFGIKFRHELPEGFKRAFGTGLLPMIFINLFIGYIGRGFIDNAAHLGGLLSGAALALVVEYQRPGERPSIAIIWRVLQILALALVVLGFYKVVQNFNRPSQPPRPQ